MSLLTHFQVTLLAFIFIPISLATSFFGMNLQELNASGQPFWVFAVTAWAIFSTALFIWGILYQWTKFNHAPYRDTTPTLTLWEGSDVRINIWRRIGLVLWLLFHGHIIWCWRSGIVFSLITKGRKGFITTCDENECLEGIELTELRDCKRPGLRDNDVFPTHSPHGPVAYVYAHSKYPSRRGFSFRERN